MRDKKTFAGCTFGILGDSYSTFDDWVPQGYASYYPNPRNVDDVLRVEDTWWHQLMQRHGMKLLVNDSYSGSTVCTHVREGRPVSSSFVKRITHAFSGQCQPDMIFVFGCTNDNWLERTVGQTKYSGRTEEDLKQVLPAYCEVLEQLSLRNPNATVVSVVNTGLRPELLAGILSANDHYGAVTVELSGIDKQNGHPSALGMRQIADQIQGVLQK